MLAAVQRGLEALYRVETELCVDDFVIDRATRDALAPARAPREQLLVAERDGELELALYVDPAVLAELAARDPRRGLDQDNLQAFVLAVEGVSHFVYVAWRARQGRPVSALELELQAEIDKFVACALAPGGLDVFELKRRLFERFQLERGMDAGERERYTVANENARAFAGELTDRYLERGAVPEMLAELRRFYRQGIDGKLARIRTGTVFRY
jgi:hypothetical protein